MLTKMLVMFACAATASAANPVPTRAQMDTLLRSAERAVREHMRDPDATKIRLTALYESGFGPHRICGEVNSKNAFGAYVGYAQFYLDPTDGTLTLQSSAENPETWAGQFQSNCKTKVEPRDK